MKKRHHPILRKRIASFVLSLTTIFVAQFSYAQLQFVQNKGQWNNNVDYKSDIPAGAFFIEKNGYTVLMENPDDLNAIQEYMHGGMNHSGNNIAARAVAPTNNTSITNTTQTILPKLVLHSHVYKVEFEGTSNNVQAIPEKALSTYNNYFVGNDSTKWESKCGIYLSVTYKNIYPNIDLHYYTNAGTLKYDFVIHPGGNADDIKMKYEGADRLEVKNKELIIGTSVGDSKELYPYTYQVQGETRQTLDCRYEVKGNIVKFKLDGNAANGTIVIDPTLIFCSFTGSTADNWGYTATPGPDGSFYAGGIVFNTGGAYSVSPGAFQTTFQGGVPDGGDPGYDMGIMKFSPDGSKRIYATYLGGSGDEQPQSMICDAQGNLIVAGRSNSTNFPATLQVGPRGGYDIVVTKFNADGTGLIGSVRMGGSSDDGVNIKDKEQLAGADEINRNYGDDARGEVILDNNNNIYLASCTQSPDFPVSNSPIQQVFGGNQDGVIIQFTPNLSGVLFSTFFGGNGYDACFVISMNPINGNLYVAGGTTSSTLPGNNTNVINSTFQGGICDGFVTELTPNGSAVIKTTYVGTSGDDLVYGLKFDNDGFPYIMGTTTGNWPVMPSTVVSNAGGKQFIAKLMPDLSAYIYSTVFGTNSAVPNISPVAFLVDRCENVYISGWGGNFDYGSGYPNAGTNGLVPTANAIKSFTDGNDFYFLVLGRGADTVLFSSFFGQQGGFCDHVDGGTSRFDANGVIYQAICANCNTGYADKGTFPTTPGAWSTVNPAGGFGCNEAAVKIAMNFAGVSASLKTEADNIPYDTSGCVALTVDFFDTIADAKQYIWSFGDGSPAITTVTDSESYTYTKPGTYRVMLIAQDSSTCNIRDTVYHDIKVGTDRAYLAFNYLKVGPCDSLEFQFKNTSVATIDSFSNKGFVWNYGDGSPNDTLGIQPHIHTFPSPGTYNVTLCVVDTFICNAPGCIDTPVIVNSNVRALFSTPLQGCVPYTAFFNNISTGGTSFLWNFGDGTTSTASSPSHLYDKVGTYIVKLIAYDPNTCNKTDTVTDTVQAIGAPTAAYSYYPEQAQVNTPTQFTNQSIGAINYIWNFGDGDTSTDANPLYQFNSTGTFDVCLIAINSAGCKDTFCRKVEALVNPLLDVPNAFTPGKPGADAIIKVVGFGIGKMDWRIYNRWGQLIFESTNPSQGWDGTYKGELQPMDVYTYTLDVDFTNNKGEFKKTGDITLLR